MKRRERDEEKCEERVTIPEVVGDRSVEEVQLARTLALLITLLDCCCCATDVAEVWLLLSWGGRPDATIC